MKTTDSVMREKIKNILLEWIQTPGTYEDPLDEILDPYSHSLAEAGREGMFTQDELNIMWMDYKALVATTKVMNRTVVGDKKLEFILDSNDQIREEILGKLNKVTDLLTGDNPERKA